MEIKTIRINPVYHHLLTNTDRYLGLYGGAGSGKSMFAAQKILLRLTTEPGHRFLFVRKVARTIRASTYQLFKDLLVQHNCSKQFRINKTEMRFTHTDTGNEIFCVGIDDPEKLKSIQGITGIWVEEATELGSEDFRQLDLRLRGYTPHYKQIMLSWNPIDENHWLKTEFCEPPGTHINTITPGKEWQYITQKEIDGTSVTANTTILRTTYLDNLFIDDQYKTVLTEKVKANKNYYKIYVLGEWGRADRHNTAYYAFQREQQIQPTPLLSQYPVLLSFDFNVIPYMTMICMQIQILPDAQVQLRVFDEFCLPHPQNSSRACVLAFHKKYKDRISHVQYTGDAQGNRRIEGSNNSTRFSAVVQALQQCGLLFNRSNYTNRANPPVMQSVEQMNEIMNGLTNYRLLIDPQCEHLIQDMENLTLYAGGILKEHATDLNGQQYEKYGHASDALRYALHRLTKDTPIMYSG